MDQDPCPDLCIAGVSVCDSRRCLPADGKPGSDRKQRPPGETDSHRKPPDRRSADLPAPGKILVPHGSGVGSGVEPALHHMPVGGSGIAQPIYINTAVCSHSVCISQNLPEFTSGFGFDGFAELARL